MTLSRHEEGATDHGFLASIELVALELGPGMEGAIHASWQEQARRDGTLNSSRLAVLWYRIMSP